MHVSCTQTCFSVQTCLPSVRIRKFWSVCSGQPDWLESVDLEDNQLSDNKLLYQIKPGRACLLRLQLIAAYCLAAQRPKLQHLAGGGLHIYSLQQWLQHYCFRSVSNSARDWQGCQDIAHGHAHSSVQMQCCSFLPCDSLCLKGNSSGPVMLSFAAETGRLNWVIFRCHMHPISLIKGMVLNAGWRLHVWTAAQAMR